MTPAEEFESYMLARELIERAEKERLKENAAESLEAAVLRMLETLERSIDDDV